MNKTCCRLLCFLVMISVSAFIPAGCSGINTREQANAAASAGLLPLERSMEAKDSSDIADWTGRQLVLNYWKANGTGGATVIPLMEKDVVTPEIKRVTGITIDQKNSFSNGGMEFNAKLDLLAASGDLPALTLSAQNPKDLIRTGMFYDLTDLLPRYCPNIMERVPPEKFQAAYIGSGEGGRLYSILNNWGQEVEDRLYKELEKDKKYRLLIPSIQSYGSFKKFIVRDDILKMIYPEARSFDELTEEYVAKGGFTKEEVYDPLIRTREEAVQFLYKVRDVIAEKGIGEAEGQPVWASYASTGSDQDNWALFACLMPYLYGYNAQDFNYYCYYSKKSKQFELPAMTGVYKPMMYEVNKMVRDGVLARESFTDDNSTFNKKMSNGQYAVNYAWNEPGNADLEKAGKAYKYRPVWLGIPVNDDTYIFDSHVEMTVSQSIFISKNKVSEEDLPQVLRAIDFMFSDAGQLLGYWGPKSAGIWEEKNGVRRFTVKELDAIFQEGYDGNYEPLLTYGFPLLYWTYANQGLADKKRMDNCLPGFAMISFIGAYNSVKKPQYVYAYNRTSTDRRPEDMKIFFDPRMVDPPQTVLSREGYVWNWTVPQTQLFADNVWAKRSLYDNAMKKCLTGLSDEDFEKKYEDFIKVAMDQNKMNENTRKQIDDYYKNIFNKDWMQYLDK